MNKLSMFLTGCAALSLVACGNDDLGENVTNPNEKPGEVAYLSINIKDANASGRAVTSTTGDKGFIFGDLANEGKVTSAKFLFYDANGVFVTEANIWDPQGPGDPDPGNVEYLGKNTLVLNGLKGSDSYPKYMLTVLNAPSTLEYGYNYSLEQTRNSLISVTADRTAPFVMSTTSFFGGKATDNTDVETSKYFVNTLVSDNFQREPAPATGAVNPVNVYVERLAAKVELSVSSELADKLVELEDGSKAYELNVTVGGNTNPGTGTEAPTTPGTEEGTETETPTTPAPGGVAATKLYVKLSSWGLNATTKNSYLSKNLDGWEATPAIDGWVAADGDGIEGWNQTNFHRSYWGKSVVYGKANPDLNYVTWTALGVKLGQPAYCSENTNNTTVVFPTASVNGEEKTSFDPAAVTSVLVQGTVCDKTGKAIDLILYNGVFYNMADFIKYELAALKAAKDLEFYFLTGTDKEDEKSYTQIDEKSVKVVSSNQGTGYVKLEAELKETVYAKTVGTDGKSVFTKTDAAAINAKFNKFAEASKAMAYKGGATYYTIPVEHLNSTTANANKNVEAKYGVVRNHWYKVVIKSLARIGQGVFDPEKETIKPEINDDPTYYMGAEIHILSWKIVNQDVTLD